MDLNYNKDNSYCNKGDNNDDKADSNDDKVDNHDDIGDMGIAQLLLLVDIDFVASGVHMLVDCTFHPSLDNTSIAVPFDIAS